jgi:hypothetical protein
VPQEEESGIRAGLSGRRKNGPARTSGTGLSQLSIMSFDTVHAQVIICQDACAEIGMFADTIRADRVVRLDDLPFRETSKESA